MIAPLSVSFRLLQPPTHERLLLQVSDASTTEANLSLVSQVVLWTTLLLSGCASASFGPEGSAYLHRETVRPPNDHLTYRPYDPLVQRL
jgi:hypothetical protein